MVSKKVAQDSRLGRVSLNSITTFSYRPSDTVTPESNIAEHKGNPA